MQAGQNLLPAVTRGPPGDTDSHWPRCHCSQGLCCVACLMLPGMFLETVNNPRIRITVYPHLGVPEFPSIPRCRLLGLFPFSSYY